MSRTMSGFVAVLALAVGAWAVWADDATTAAKGTVSGTVVDKDGKPVTGARVAVIDAAKAREMIGRRGKAGATTQEASKGRRERREGRRGEMAGAAAHGTTDAQGKFTLGDIPAGEYLVIGFERGKGIAHARVAVKPGGTESVSLTMKERGEGKAGKSGKSAAPSSQ